MEELEVPAVLVDEFRNPGEAKLSALSRAGEEIFQQYNSKLKETEASHGIHFVISIKKLVLLQGPQYDTTAHVKTPKGATPTQAPTYSHLSRCEGERGGGEKGSGEYQHLDHNKNEDDSHKNLPPQEYGRIEKVSCQLNSLSMAKL